VTGVTEKVDHPGAKGSGKRQSNWRMKTRRKYCDTMFYPLGKSEFPPGDIDLAGADW